MSLENMPDDAHTTDDFDKAGTSAAGEIHIVCKDWNFVAGTGGNSDQLRGFFAITERPDNPGLDEKVQDTFWLDGNSLWKLRDLAIAMGQPFSGAVSWKEVAEACVGQDCWANLTHQKGKDGRTYARLAKFSANLAELQGPGNTEAPL